MQDSVTKTQDSVFFKTWKTGFRIQDSGFRIHQDQDPEFRVQDAAGLGNHIQEFRVQDSQKQDPGFRIQDAGCRI